MPTNKAMFTGFFSSEVAEAPSVGKTERPSEEREFMDILFTEHEISLEEELVFDHE